MEIPLKHKKERTGKCIFAHAGSLFLRESTVVPFQSLAVSGLFKIVGLFPLAYEFVPTVTFRLVWG